MPLPTLPAHDCVRYAFADLTVARLRALCLCRPCRRTTACAMSLPTLPAHDCVPMSLPTLPAHDCVRYAFADFARARLRALCLCRPCRRTTVCAMPLPTLPAPAARAPRP